ncbi:TIGR00282 family metallophosphoesterase [Pigmentibacter sp. JX0631]|uniref:TIGR00282 family metallophosphoesterase n=1 Tax=Pigmentibacter sp. JX0631 TaxID=2976982 RepID=UPI0024697B67|nr:TIGR00282 family metallophosphoesterase [Pigmentibacter sp. JX0631]WGL58911.1 TIGR00282 family metallophosphoesterase [Pigmentibacter sp. JX0631]
MQSKIIVNHFSHENFYPSLVNLTKTQEQSIKILMLGDVLGRGGRRIVKKILPEIKQAIQLDFITINGENLAGGFGITHKIYDEMKLAGVDAFTMGNHWKDKSDVHILRKKHHDLILPQNLIGISDIDKVPQFFLEKRNKTLNIINLMGNFAMKEEYKDPFEFLKHEKDNFQDKVNSGSHIVIADIHAEASSEKQAIAWYYDGILAALIGTHTHTPTSDERITENGTAFLTDVGMTGPYDSVIGMEKSRVISKFTNPQLKLPYEVAEKDLWFCGFLVEICPKLNKTIACHRLQCRSLEEETWLVSSILKNSL